MMGREALVRDEGLVDSSAARVFLMLNGFDFTPDDDRATEFVPAAAAGESDDMDTLAATLREWSRNGA